VLVVWWSGVWCWTCSCGVWSVVWRSDNGPEFRAVVWSRVLAGCLMASVVV